jgi:trk system potassium uptake protein TrkH
VVQEVLKRDHYHADDPIRRPIFGAAQLFRSALRRYGVSDRGTIGTLDGKPHTFLFSRAWMQWLGGLGITVLSVAVMIQPGLAAKRLDFDEDYDDDLK